MIELRIGALAAFLLATSTATAADYRFAYTSSQGVVSGIMSGTLQADNNTLVLDSISAPRFNGTPGPGVSVIGSWHQLVMGGSVPPTVTIDGSLMGFIACVPAQGCQDGFTFTYEGLVFSPARFYSDGFYGALINGETYNPANWSMSVLQSDAAPEPASWMLMVGGFGLVGAALRRRYRGSFFPASSS